MVDRVNNFLRGPRDRRDSSSRPAAPPASLGSGDALDEQHIAPSPPGSAKLGRVKSAALLFAVVLVAAVVVSGLAQRPGAAQGPAGGGASATPRDAGASLGEQQAAVAGAPEPLAGLYAQPSALLEGGADALEDRLAELEEAGVPVVINKWASWCAPCRYEVPFFQEAVTRYGDRVAFLGLNSADAPAPAAGFLETFPLAYPSYVDPREGLARDIGAGRGFPVTVFLDGEGGRYVAQGAYATPARLAGDIERYALGSGSGSGPR
jgi:cytochrome c biogenesis protein CcmG/thiol:disulfide interchange protein DsbE